MRVLVLTTDAYGGHGGIALYNRDIIDALALMPAVKEIVVIPRTMPLKPEGIPEKVRFCKMWQEANSVSSRQHLRRRRENLI